MNAKFQTIEHSSLEVIVQHQWISFSLSVFYLILIFLKLRIISSVCGCRQYGCLTEIKCLFSNHGSSYHFSKLIFIAGKQTFPIRNIGATQSSYLFFLYQNSFVWRLLVTQGGAWTQAKSKVSNAVVNIVPKHWNLIKKNKLKFKNTCQHLTCLFVRRFGSLIVNAGDKIIVNHKYLWIYLSLITTFHSLRVVIFFEDVDLYNFHWSSVASPCIFN